MVQSQELTAVFLLQRSCARRLSTSRLHFLAELVALTPEILSLPFPFLGSRWQLASMIGSQSVVIAATHYIAGL